MPRATVSVQKRKGASEVWVVSCYLVGERLFLNLRGLATRSLLNAAAFANENDATEQADAQNATKAWGRGFHWKATREPIP